MDDEDSGTYYIWKWADNNVPGNPGEICSILEVPEWHFALTPFDSTPVVKSLSKVAKALSKNGDEWTWQPISGDGPEDTYFMILWGPLLSRVTNYSLSEHIEPFESALERLGLIACHAVTGLLPGNFPPKINKIMSGQLETGPEYDVSEARVFDVIKGLRADLPHPTACFIRNNRDYVQTLRVNECYLVEWRDYYDLKKPHDHWRMHNPDSVEEHQEFFRLPDVLDVFAAFMRGEPRPQARHWGNMNDSLNNPSR